MLHLAAAVRAEGFGVRQRGFAPHIWQQHGQRYLHPSAYHRAQVSEDRSQKTKNEPPPLSEARKSQNYQHAESKSVSHLSRAALKKKAKADLKQKKLQARAQARRARAASKAAKASLSLSGTAPGIFPVKDATRQWTRSHKHTLEESQRHLKSVDAEVSDEQRNRSRSLYSTVADAIASGLSFGQQGKEVLPETMNAPLPVDEATKQAHDKIRLALAMKKAERMENQARFILEAIREARERGSDDEDDTFLHPYPAGSPPANIRGEEGVWLNLGPDPEAWGKELPPVKDLWHEVLALGLTKEIVVSERPFAQRLGDTEGMSAKEQEEAFGDLVDDYDLEDHERLEQLGDSIVNMSSRLLAYQSYPDINEGALTGLSNYPAQNNILALLFQECGLAARRDALRAELQRKNGTFAVSDDEADGRQAQGTAPWSRTKQAEDKKDELPLNDKRDADMFEAYVAAVFLTHENSFQVVHKWLSDLFRPFHDQAYRFMLQRNQTLALLHASRQKQDPKTGLQPGDARALAPSYPELVNGSSSPAAAFANMTKLYPGFAWWHHRRTRKLMSNGIPSKAFNSSEPFVMDNFLTVAARARRTRDERVREQVRIQKEQELMKMGWFQKGFLNLRKGFRQYLMGRDVVREEEEQLRQRAEEEKAREKKDVRQFRRQQRFPHDTLVQHSRAKHR